MTDTSIPTTVAPQVLLVNHFKTLKLPTFAREYEKVGIECAREDIDYARYLHFGLGWPQITDTRHCLTQFFKPYATIRVDH